MKPRPVALPAGDPGISSRSSHISDFQTGTLVMLGVVRSVLGLADPVSEYSDSLRLVACLHA